MNHTDYKLPLVAVKGDGGFDIRVVRRVNHALRLVTLDEECLIDGKMTLDVPLDRCYSVNTRQLEGVGAAMQSIKLHEALRDRIIMNMRKAHDDPEFAFLFEREQSKIGEC